MPTKNILKSEEVKHLARLAQIILTDDEITLFANQFGETIEYIHNMCDIDTDSVPETHHVTSLSNVYFNDGEKNELSLAEEDALSQASAQSNNMFKVKRILEE